MLTWIREKFGTIIIGGIIGLLALVFTVYGIITPKNSQGGAVAGTVNGDPIPISEFQTALNRQIDMYKQMSGGQLSDEQMKALRIRQSVFRGLVQRKLLVQEAYKEGTVASDEAVKETIEGLPYFKKDGHFDVVTYRQLLEANHRTPGDFEREVREDMSAQSWQDYFQRRVRVSDEEAKQEFLISQDKRNIKYVLLTNETGRHGVTVSSDEVKKFLADPGRSNIAKAQFEAKKQTVYKGKTFDAVKEGIAKDLVAGEKISQIDKINQKLADEVLPLLHAGKTSDAKINAILKPYGTQLKTTGLISREASYLPGIGQSEQLLADAFAAKSPIDPSQGGKAKKYTSGGGTVVALVEESQKPDPAKFDTERSKLIQQIASRKERELFDAWLNQVAKKSKIEPNMAVLNPDES